MRRRNRIRPSPLTRAVAALATALVLALTVFAASPALHQWLHGHEPGHPRAAPDAPARPSPPDDDDDGCVVTLFAQGLVLSLCVFALLFSGRIPRQLDRDVPERVIPAEPHFRLLPTQAPPFQLG
jgi:hypothetical protein